MTLKQVNKALVRAGMKPLKSGKASETAAASRQLTKQYKVLDAAVVALEVFELEATST